LRLPEDPEARERTVAAWERFCEVFPNRFYVDRRGREYLDPEKNRDQLESEVRLLSAGFHSMMGYFRDDRPLVELGFESPHAAAEAGRQAVGHLTPLRSVADHITRLPMLPGNRLEPLHNGEQVYPRMLDAIRSAERSVTLASYIFDWDDIGHDFAEALDAAAQRGVKVHALIDGIGALGLFSRMGRKLQKSGAEVAVFFPLKFPLGRVRINLRNHRKILVVDGRTGFAGGMNISARHLLQSESESRVEDLHFELTGPVVGELQHTFAEDWAMTTGDVIRGDDYFPELSEVGEAWCRGIASGPDEDFGKLRQVVLAALSAARGRVTIVTPYFAPDEALISAMITAALRGVHVTLVLPSVSDIFFMRWLADAYLWQFLKHGIHVYRRRPPFVHTKLMIVDGRWVLLGSANIDARSLRWNFEFNVEAYDEALAGELTTWLDGITADLAPVTLEELDNRPKWKRLRDGLAKMAAPYL